MRVATKTLYDTTSIRLGQITGELNEANKVVSTGKRINALSDDPLGLTQVLDIRSNLSNLEQLERNISTGRTWLNTGETALNSVKDSVSDTKVLCLAMRNDTVNATDRNEAAAQVNGILKQVVELANSMVNGRYIFAGTKTDTPPFKVDDEETPTVVTYSGNESGFVVKIGQNENLQVGHDGESVFGNSYFTMDGTNNTIDFKERMAAGGPLTEELTATIRDGTYTADELAQAIEAVMRASSANSIDYEVSYDETSRRFTIEDGAGANDLNELQLLWHTGTHAGTTAAFDLGFGTNGDDTGEVSHNGVSGVQRGIFKTLIDLRGYLEGNDEDGIDRSISRLETEFNRFVTAISDAGLKEVRLDIKEAVIADLDLSLEEKRSQLEDADIIEAISDLQSKEFTYQAALASSARVMKLSLVDYL